TPPNRYTVLPICAAEPKLAPRPGAGTSALRVHVLASGSNTQVWSMRVLGPAPRPPPNTYSLLSAADAITVDCDGPSVSGTGAPDAHPSKQAPTMSEPVTENALVPHALLAVTRQKYCVAMLRSVGTVKLVSVVEVSTMRLVNAASRATWTWYAAAP